jgi:hypothetical protein
LYDSQAIRCFVGMDLGRESAPDATTLLTVQQLIRYRDIGRVGRRRTSLANSIRASRLIGLHTQAGYKTAAFTFSHHAEIT